MGSAPVAFKEWAVVIKALLDGKQILLLRKGGIAEETRAFKLESRSFLLYPGYEHQHKQLLKDDFHGDLDTLLSEWNPNSGLVSITCRAEVVDDIEIRTQEELDKLNNFHIWTERFSEERLKWKKNQPLHLLLLRIYRLDTPLIIPVKPEYGGCKSWIRLDIENGDLKGKPVMDDKAFNPIILGIKEKLTRVDN